LNDTNVEAEVYDGLVWRLSVRKRGISTMDGVSVGDNALSVLRRNNFMNLEIGPGQIIVLISDNPCGLSYLTDAEVTGSLKMPLNQKIAVRLLKSAKIKAIIASGCD
jgi:hypothetical protein